MTAFLPPEILELFAPREPIPYLPPVTKLSHKVKRQPYTGVGSFDGFEDPKDTPPPTLIETREQRLARKKQEQAEQAAYKLEQELASWDPHNIPEGTSDALKTLFVARLNHETSEAKLRSEFESYGTIKKIVMISDKKSGKPRGYAFIEYDHERDMHVAYKRAHGIRIDGNRLIVDVERSRTVKGWLPKRLGGGISIKQEEDEEVNDKHSRHDSREKEYPKRRERDRARERERSSSRTRTRERRTSGSRSKDYRRDAKRRSRDRDKENDRHGSDDDRKDFRDRRKDRDDKREVQREIRDRRRRSRSRDRKRSQRSRSKSKDRERPRRRFTEYERDKEPHEVVTIKSEPSSDSD